VGDQNKKNSFGPTHILVGGSIVDALKKFCITSSIKLETYVGCPMHGNRWWVVVWDPFWTRLELFISLVLSKIRQ